MHNILESGLGNKASLVSVYSVYENVRLPLDICHESPAQAHKKTIDMINDVGLILRKDFLPEKPITETKKRNNK